MIVIVCVDDNMGLMFNNRRQSRDEEVLKRIIEISKNSVLYMNEYSYSLFENKNADNIKVSENFLEIASEGEYCFLENEKIKDYEDKIEKIIIFKWNRNYPSDFKFDISADLYKYKKTGAFDFKGSSHEKITMEIYGK